ncbi:hypothetical protein [Bacillus sp. SM2101]|uniref:hypothetical protein n=1 Tax=Bacillus sp. SM2101 TaxID=2805366 RepID=UPI001BDE9B3B|nr:hypothetical protein [Bacillus sp. SM2101]
MAIGIAIGIILFGLVLAFQLSHGKTKKRRCIIWGVTIMLAIAPFFSWLVGISYGIYVGDGFAGGALMVILFLIIFLSGLLSLLVGVLGSDEKEIIEK